MLSKLSLFTKKGSTSKQNPPLRWMQLDRKVYNWNTELLIAESEPDVTITCGKEVLKAHRSVLMKSSRFLRRAFLKAECQHPFLIVKGLTPDTLRCVIKVMYEGKVGIKQEQFEEFMAAVEHLKLPVKFKEEQKEMVLKITGPNPETSKSHIAPKGMISRFLDNITEEDEKNDDDNCMETWI